VSLYEVSDIVVGTGFLARDLIRGGEPVRIEEKSATKGLAQWDCISTRVVSVNEKVQISRRNALRRRTLALANRLAWPALQPVPEVLVRLPEFHHCVQRYR
jgi:hypothetical protein